MAEKTEVHHPADGPASDVESREETVSRVLQEDAEVREAHGVDETPELGGVGGDTPGADASTRRGLNLALMIWFGAGAVIGGGIGLALGFGLREIVGTNALGGAGDGAALPISLALVGALVGAIIAAFVQLGEEDGRVERAVEGDVDGDTDVVGRGPSPDSAPAGGLVGSPALPVVLGAIGIIGAVTVFAAVASVAAIWLGLRVRARATRIRSRSYGTLGVISGVVGLVLTAALLVLGASVLF